MSLFVDGQANELVLRIASPGANRMLFNARQEPFVDFATTSYLGLERDPRCLRAFADSAARHGLYQYCSPIFLRPPAQVEVEASIASVTGHESAIVFPNVTALHSGCLPLIAANHGQVLVDQYAHESIHDALRPLPRGKVRRFKHCDYCDMRAQLKASGAWGKPPLVVIDGVYSMSGAMPAIDVLGSALAGSEWGLYVDDSHGFGVLGDRGEGMAGICRGQSCISYYVGSLSKAMAVPLGFIAARANIIAVLRRRAHALLFSGSVPIPFLDVARVVLGIAASEEGALLRSRLGSNGVVLAEGLKESGIGSILHGGGIVAVEMVEERSFRELCVHLHESKVAFNPVMYPAIPRGRFRVRFCVSAAHTRQQIQSLVDVCRRFRERMGAEY